jgi:predicted Zn-dependent protease
MALIGLTLLVAACYTNSETGRKQLLLFPKSVESELGVTTYAQIKQETPTSTDPAKSDLVNRVGRRVAAVVDLPGAQWEFTTFAKDDIVNAFCLPGGKIGVYTGILPITQTEAELAAVIGHEIAHATARHGGERMSQGLLVNLGGLGLAMALQDKPRETVQLALVAYGVATTVGVMLPYSRSHELEADRLGMNYMAKAGYDPTEAIKLWRRMKAESAKHGSKPPEFLSTHPAEEHRIAELEKHLPQALALYIEATK